MAHRVVYHPKAEAELDAIYNDIEASTDATIAGRYVRGLIAFIHELELFPERGTVRESRVTGLRIIGYRKSVSIAFYVRDDIVTILGLFRRGRNITEDILYERDE
jgi:toxin ParE1/3/4